MEYIKNRNKMLEIFIKSYQNLNIVSAFFLRNFLYLSIAI